MLKINMMTSAAPKRRSKYTTEQHSPSMCNYNFYDCSSFKSTEMKSKRSHTNHQRLILELSQMAGLVEKAIM